MPLPGRIGLLVDIVQVHATPEPAGIGDLKITTAHIQGDGVCAVGLELQGMSARSGCSIHDGQSPLKALVVVAAHFGNHKGGGVVWTDRTADSS